jgi:hypothetical protein
MIKPLINVAVPRRPHHPSRSLTLAPRKQRANFDVAVNRWPHGYAPEFNTLWEPDLERSDRTGAGEVNLRRQRDY